MEEEETSAVEEDPVVNEVLPA